MTTARAPALSRQPAVLVDMDGTLCDVSTRSISRQSRWIHRSTTHVRGAPHTRQDRVVNLTSTAGATRS